MTVRNVGHLFRIFLVQQSLLGDGGASYFVWGLHIFKTLVKYDL